MFDMTPQGGMPLAMPDLGQQSPMMQAPMMESPMMQAPPTTPLQPPSLPVAPQLQPPPLTTPGMPAEQLGLPPAQVLDYQAQYNVDEREAAVRAMMDTIWEKVARKCGLLGKDPGQDQLIWQEHQAFVSGEAEADPLQEYPEALEELEDAVLEAAKKIAYLR